jgi:hypothetical protein
LGGVYFSQPWNPRDEQPYDMEYEIIEEADKASIKLWGTDFNTKLYTEIRMILKEDSRIIKLEIIHKNNTDGLVSIPYWDRFIFNPGVDPAGIVLDIPYMLGRVLTIGLVSWRDPGLVRQT